jgi:ribose transport system permease protein
LPESETYVSTATAEPGVLSAPDEPGAEGPRSGPTAAGQPASKSRVGRVAQALSPRNFSALYVFAAIFVLFSILVPDTFLTTTTWRTLLDNQAIVALAAVALVPPLAAGVFDLAIGAEIGFSGVLAAWLIAEKGVPAGPAIVLCLLAGVLIGLLNGGLVTRARIMSFVATLAMSSILMAATNGVSDGIQITGVPDSFQTLATTQILGIQSDVYIMVVVALVVWYVLERTRLGRRIYATGGNPEAARLSGVNTAGIIVGSFVVCGVIAAFTGVLLTSQLATGDPTLGPSYLLPAFSAAFLGSTQFGRGRFNVLGTVITVYVLALGVKGLQLYGAPSWVPDLFNGVALLLAVGIAQFRRRAPQRPSHSEKEQ